MIAERRRPTHRPPWRRHSVQAIALSRAWGDCLGLTAQLEPGSRAHGLALHATRSLELAVRAQVASDNRMEKS